MLDTLLGQGLHELVTLAVKQPICHIQAGYAGQMIWHVLSLLILNDPCILQFHCILCIHTMYECLQPSQAEDKAKRTCLITPCLGDCYMS